MESVSTGNSITTHVNNDREVFGQVTIKWGYCEINPITQVIEHFYKLRKKN